MDAPSDAPPPRDDFLDRLKSLGYLDNPLERFFIGRAHGRTGILLANIKVALKVGLLGGVFLGVVTALGLSLLSPETFPTLSAVAALAGYFAVIFTTLFTALELAICLAATVLSRLLRRFFTRTEMVALYSAVFAALVVILYGTLWWWAEGAEVRLLSARALAAFAVIALLAAAVAFLTRMAVTSLLALLGGADLAAPGKGRATRIYLAVFLLGLAVFAGHRLLFAESPPSEASPFEKADSPYTVTLIAVDGAGLDFFRLLCERSDLPNLDSLVRSGFIAPLEPAPLPVNPAVWTTVATGVEPAKHSVTAFSGQELPGLGLYIRERTGFGLYDALLRALPALGLSRRSPLERLSLTYPHVWDVLALKGELSGVVNWWGTWPADSFHGFLVTDRMYPKLQVAAATAAAAAFESEVYPRGLFDELSSYRTESARVADDPFAAAADIDRFAVTSLILALPDYDSLSFKAVYLPGLDVYSNSLHDRLQNRRDLAANAALVDGASQYWRFLDSLLAPLIADRSENDILFLVADPGMLKGPEERNDKRDETGFVVISGGPASVARADAPLALVDIAPSILYLLGFPVSAEMDGAVALDAFDPEYVKTRPVQTVETFGRLEVKRSLKYSVDRQLVERLKSLGYLQR